MCKSNNGNWIVKTIDRRLYCEDKSGRVVLYNIFFKPISFAFFDNSEQFLFVRIKCSKSGLFIYKFNNNEWQIVDELSSAGVSLFYHNLRKVYLDKKVLTFIYNNRIKKYDISTGELISNNKKMGARLLQFSGEDVSERLGL